MVKPQEPHQGQEKPQLGSHIILKMNTETLNQKLEKDTQTPVIPGPEETLRQMTQTTATPKPNEKDGKKETKIDVLRMPHSQKRKPKRREKNDLSQN